MKHRERGQLLVLAAVGILAVMLLLALVVDGGRIFVERQELRSAADAAAQAGMVVVGDVMVTQAVARQLEAAARPPCDPEESLGTPAPVCTPTPPPQDIPAWLTDADRGTLIAPAVQTSVAASVLEYAERNGAGSAEVELEYPSGYSHDDRLIRLRVSLRRQTAILLAGLLRHDLAEIRAEAVQSLPQRR